MSKLLINEHPLQVLPSLAVKIGLNEAIVLQQVHYWAIQGKNEIGGHSWVYNSVAEWKRQFPFWSEQTIRRTIANLKERGVLVAKCLSSEPFNRTPYYRIDHGILESIEHSNLESTKNHRQSDTAVDTKLVETVDAKLEPTVDAKLVSTTNTETNQETTSETNRAGAPTPEKSSPVQGDLLGDTKPAKKTAAAQKSEAFDARAYLLNAGVDQQIASDWLAVRKKKNLPPTLTVMQKLERDGAAAGKSFVQTITHCAERSHAAFYPDRDMQAAQGRSQGGGFMSKQERAEAENARRRAEREANKQGNQQRAEFEMPPHMIPQQRPALLSAPIHDDDVGF